MSVPIRRTVAVVWTFWGDPDAVDEAVEEWKSEKGILHKVLTEGPNGDYTTPSGKYVEVDVNVLQPSFLGEKK